MIAADTAPAPDARARRVTSKAARGTAAVVSEPRDDAVSCVLMLAGYGRAGRRGNGARTIDAEKSLRQVGPGAPWCAYGEA
ncbi:hypothetical protein GCM10009758_26040 [Microbacterium hatanonis]